MTSPVLLYIDLTVGPVPQGLVGDSASRSDRVRDTAFRLMLGERCGRCNRDLVEHHWQIVDTGDPEQDGVIDCGLAS